MATAGATLAVYHRMMAPEDPVPAYREALAELAWVARRLLIPTAEARRLADRAGGTKLVANSYRDFGPQNLRRTPTGEFYLLDPPPQKRPSLVHEDIATFLSEMRRRIARQSNYRGGSALRNSFRTLRAWFLDSYAATAVVGSLGREDRALIALFETRKAAARARRHWPSRRQDLWYLRLAAGRWLAAVLTAPIKSSKPVGR